MTPRVDAVLRIIRPEGIVTNSRDTTRAVKSARFNLNIHSDFKFSVLDIGIASLGEALVELYQVSMAHNGDPKFCLQEESAETQENVAPSAVDGSNVPSCSNRISPSQLNGKELNIVYKPVVSDISDDEEDEPQSRCLNPAVKYPRYDLSDTGIQRAFRKLGRIIPIAKRKYEVEGTSSENTHTPPKVRVTSKATLATGQLSNAEIQSETQSKVCSQGNDSHVKPEEQNKENSKDSVAKLKTHERGESPRDNTDSVIEQKTHKREESPGDNKDSVIEQKTHEREEESPGDNTDSVIEQKTHKREESPRDNTDSVIEQKTHERGEESPRDNTDSVIEQKTHKRGEESPRDNTDSQEICHQSRRQELGRLFKRTGISSRHQTRKCFKTHIVSLLENYKFYGTTLLFQRYSGNPYRKDARILHCNALYQDRSCFVLPPRQSGVSP
ncbi:hypothetical protein ElyMa_000075000 [Elysia marginata]|uniref:Uncharacterized protein n=1 Tax=Elysia marginata TaxID=1093978 RepID=A0AAV4EGX9_9GAST|nr:hypothetical protein ElyMa_000075000 [Elysia marginata]